MASTAQETTRPAAATQPASSAVHADRSSAPDVVVVGAGFAGLYMLHKLRTLGFSARGSSRRPTTSAAPGTGTAIPARAATSPPPTTPTASTPSWRRPGPGRRSTPRSPRSCATPSSWPTATTCGATSISARGWTSRAGTTPRAAGRSTPAAARRCAALLHHGQRLSVDAQVARHRGRGPLHRARSTSPAAGRTRAWTSRASGWRSSAPARRASSPSRSSPARPASSRCSSAPRTSPSRRATGRSPAERLQQLDADRDAYRQAAKWSRGGVPMPTDWSSAATAARACAGSASRRPGSRASCSAFSTSSPTRA